MARQTQKWKKVKSKIFDRGFDSIAEFARAVGCTTEAVRLTTKGECPRVRKKMEAILK